MQSSVTSSLLGLLQVLHSIFFTEGETLHTLLEDNMIDDIILKHLVSVDRSNLKTLILAKRCLCDKLQALVPHSFIPTQQAALFAECKSTLKPEELLAQADFSDSFVLRDAAQAYNNNQATVYRFVVYLVKFILTAL